jgi:putative transposase
MLRSYTRAINKEQRRSGCLFREGTKAVCLNKTEGLSPSWYAISGITTINIQHPEHQYPQVCFDYIHYNPVKHKLVKSPGLWEFSSFSEYSNDIGKALVNKEKALELSLFFD